jgi:outer membrane lipoprotein-sorting protein
MERASDGFKTFSADLATVKYDALLDEFYPKETGKFYYSRAEDGSALIRWEILKPGEKILTIQEREALLYQPKIKAAQKYRLKANKDKAEYLALGIGQSPSELRKTFNIRYLGSEEVNGYDCSAIELTPRDPKTASMFSSIIVWIKKETGVSTRMKLVEPYKDYITVDFSNEKLNEKISRSLFSQKLPDGVDVLSLN